MTREQIVGFIAAIIYLAILYMLVRPGSKGADAVGKVLSALADLVRGAIGYTYDSSSGNWNAPLCLIKDCTQTLRLLTC